MFGLSPIHWIILLVVILIFGSKRLRNIGSDLGSAVKSFKNGMQENPPPADQAAAASTTAPGAAPAQVANMAGTQAETIEVKAVEKV